MNLTIYDNHKLLLKLFNEFKRCRGSLPFNMKYILQHEISTNERFSVNYWIDFIHIWWKHGPKKGFHNYSTLQTLRKHIEQTDLRSWSNAGLCIKRWEINRYFVLFSFVSLVLIGPPTYFIIIQFDADVNTNYLKYKHVFCVTNIFQTFKESLSKADDEYNIYYY